VSEIAFPFFFSFSFLLACSIPFHSSTVTERSKIVLCSQEIHCKCIGHVFIGQCIVFAGPCVAAEKRFFFSKFFFFFFRFVGVPEPLCPLAEMLSTVCILALVSQTQAGIFDTLFGVVKTVVNNNGQIQVGDIVKNVAMTNMINLPNIPGVDIGGLLNGVGGLVGMKIFGGNNMAQPTATQPGVDPNAGGADPNAGGADPNAGGADPNAGGADPNAGGADPNAGANAGGSGAGGLLNTASNWFGNFFQPNAGANTDPSNSWLNVLSSGANALGGLTGGATMPTNNNGANNNNNNGP
jgi:hypothetical protein